MTAHDERLEAYFKTVTHADAVEASGFVLDLLSEGTAPDRITTEVLAPAQARVGELWEGGHWSVADEHAATAVTETALAALSAAAGRGKRTGTRHVAVACAEGEWHTLPARMAATVASTSDSRVTVLGPSMPADQLGQRLAAGDVDLLALSCTMPPNLLGAADCVRAAHEAGVPVLAGGRAFGSSPRRALAIGADAWAADATALGQPTPGLAAREVVIPADAALLDRPDDAVVLMAYERLAGALPHLQPLGARHRAPALDDLRWMSRYTGASVLTDDPSVLDEFLEWLIGLPDGRWPRDALAAAVLVMADTVEPSAPTGAQVLRGAADRLGDGRRTSA